MKRRFLFASCLSFALLVSGATPESSLKDGIVWYFTTANNSVTLCIGSVGACVHPITSGILNVPRTLKSLKVTAIGAGAFTNCAYLTAVNLPSTVTSIGAGAFAGCTQLKSILIGADSMTFKSSSFAKCPAFTEFATTSTAYSVVGGVLYNAARTKLVRCPTALASVSVPAETISITKEAFSCCTALSTLTFAGDTNSLVTVVNWGLSDAIKASVKVRYPQAYAANWEAALAPTGITHYEAYAPKEHRGCVISYR